VPVYTTSELERELRQAELITNLIQYTFDPVASEGLVTRRPYAVIVSQDCDLLWDFQAKVEDKPRDLIGVLFYEAEPTPQVRLPGPDILRRIRRFGEERYHLLRPVPAEFDLLGTGLPELIVDFRRCFTVGADEVYRQIAIAGEEGAKRRCRLDVPYREHLQSRAAFYLQRVALPTE
jgi:hypothetical protein